MLSLLISQFHVFVALKVYLLDEFLSLFLVKIVVSPLALANRGLEFDVTIYISIIHAIQNLLGILESTLLFMTVVVDTCASVETS